MKKQESEHTLNKKEKPMGFCFGGENVVESDNLNRQVAWSQEGGPHTQVVTRQTE